MKRHNPISILLLGLIFTGCSAPQNMIHAFKLPANETQRSLLKDFANRTANDEEYRKFCQASREEIEAKITLIGDKAGWGQVKLDSVRKMEQERFYTARDTYSPTPIIAPETLDTNLEKGEAIRSLEKYDQFWASAPFRYPDVWKAIPKENMHVSSIYFSRIQCEEQIEVLRTLKEVLRNSDFPNDETFGEGTLRSLFFITQHADDDVEFQSEMLTKFQSNLSLIRPARLAMLTDRVKMNSGALQIYGTQVQCLDGKYQPQPVVEPEKLDERRASVGLETFAEYAKHVPGCGN